MATQQSTRDGSPEYPVELSIIIGSYNARDLLAECLDSIYRNPPRESFEIIVVDDASTDGTSETVRECFPEVRLVRNEINSNYAGANNLALGLAKGHYLYLLNNDTIMLPEALDRMIAFLREHPEAGGVGSRLLNEDGSTQWSVKPLPNAGAALFGARSIITQLFPRNRFSRRHLLHLGRDLNTPFVAGYVSGASMMMPREVFDKVGDLDKRFFYFIDADYCKRIADAGYKCYYLPTASVVHLNHKGGSMVSFRRRFYALLNFHMGSYIYYRKHIQRSPWSAMHVVVSCGLFARFVMAVAVQAGAEASTLIRSIWQRSEAVE